MNGFIGSAGLSEGLSFCCLTMVLCMVFWMWRAYANTDPTAHQHHGHQHDADDGSDPLGAAAATVALHAQACRGSLKRTASPRSRVLKLIGVAVTADSGRGRTLAGMCAAARQVRAACRPQASCACLRRPACVPVCACPCISCRSCRARTRSASSRASMVPRVEAGQHQYGFGQAIQRANVVPRSATRSVPTISRDRPVDAAGSRDVLPAATRLSSATVAPVTIVARSPMTQRWPIVAPSSTITMLPTTVPSPIEVVTSGSFALAGTAIRLGCLADEREVGDHYAVMQLHAVADRHMVADDASLVQPSTRMDPHERPDRDVGKDRRALVDDGEGCRHETGIDQRGGVNVGGHARDAPP